MTLTLVPALLAAYAYTGWKLYHGLARLTTWPKEPLKFYLLAGAVYLNLHPLLLLLLHTAGFKSFVRSVQQGQKLWDVLFTYPFWLGLVFVIELIPWLLVTDVIKIPLFPLFQRHRTTWLDIQSKAVLALAGVLAVYVLFRVFVDTNHIRVTRTELPVKDLPEGLHGLRIVHISDLQADPHTGRSKLRRYVKKIHQVKPDVVFFSGDLVTSGTDFIELGARALGRVRSKYGVYACLGDHDYWASAELVAQRLEDQGIVLKENANHFVRIGQDSLMVTFITNIYSKRANLDQINALMGSQPRGAVDLVLTHQPSESLIELAADRGYHLLLAGHTHGGQVVFRPFGVAITPTRFESPFFRGLHRVDGMLVSINNGLGFTFAPIRYGAPAEVTVIRLVPGSGTSTMTAP